MNIKPNPIELVGFTTVIGALLGSALIRLAIGLGIVLLATLTTRV